MSELKAFNSERIYWAVEQVERKAGDIDELHLDENEFYLKSEADKVLAEKDKEIKELKEERRWRKFREEKPKEKQWILVYYPNHSQFTTGVELRRWDDGCKYDVEVQEVYDKWMPLPSAPKEDK